MRAVIDCTELHSPAELHRELREALGLPDWYGGNLDALHDCLSVTAEEVELCLENFDQLEKNLGGYGERLLRVLGDLSIENQKFSYKICRGRCISMSTEQLLDKWIAEHRQEMIDELGLWVSHPSVSRADLAAPGAPYGPDCRRMLDFALERGRHYGFKTEDYDGYCGAILDGDGEREIGMVCHLDVVPEGDHWIYEPYRMSEKDGFLIGRGVGDNKGPGVLGLFLMRFFRDSGIKLDHTLRLMLGCAEETGMDDFKHYVDVLGGKVPEMSIVADAGFPVCYAQKGGYDGGFRIPAGKNIVDFTAGTVRNAIPDTAVLVVNGVSLDAAKRALEGVEKIDVEADGENVRITAHGKGGHAAMPEEGVQNNAIIIAADAGVLLEKTTGIDLAGCKFLSEAFATAFGEGLGIGFADEMSGRLTINAGIIHRQPDCLMLDIDIRYPVTADADLITRRMSEKLAEYGGSLAYSDIAKPYYIDPKDPKVEALMSSYREITGDETEPYAMGGGTYSRVVPNACTFGPGLRTRVKPEFLPEGHGGAHGPDETLHIDSWLTGFKIYAQSIIRLDKALSNE